LDVVGIVWLCDSAGHSAPRRLLPRSQWSREAEVFEGLRHSRWVNRYLVGVFMDRPVPFEALLGAESGWRKPKLSTRRADHDGVFTASGSAADVDRRSSRVRGTSGLRCLSELHFIW
jgi:hypothetical protein